MKPITGGPRPNGRAEWPEGDALVRALDLEAGVSEEEARLAIRDGRVLDPPARRPPEGRWNLLVILGGLFLLLLLLGFTHLVS